MTRVAIVFVHGLLGFAKFGFPGMRVCYFKGLCDQLGEDVYFPALPGTATVKQRAKVLATFVDSLPHDDIRLIGHSMGGLDGRYLIHHLDPQHRIKMLVSIATPHRGSSIGNWAVNKNNAITALIRRITRPALDDLKVNACEAFNVHTPDREDVLYWSYSGERSVEKLPFWLKPWGRILAQNEGANDGMVSICSARWGKY